MSGFNLSEWALRHRSFVWYLMLAIVLAGGLSYTRLGRQEDPSFTIKAMVVQANWPGATVEEMTNQVTDRIERKLQELGQLDFTKSYTTLGPDHGLRQPQGRHAEPRHPGHLGPGAQQGQRCQGRLSRQRAGPVLQRPVRRRVRQHLCAHRRRSLVPAVARLCRAGARPDPEDSRRRQGRAAGRAGRGRPSQLLDPPYRRAGRRPAGGAEQPAAAECGGAVRHRAGRPRDGEPAGERPVHLGRKPSRRQHPGQRSFLPAGRRRDRHAGLCRSTPAHVPLQRPAGDRHRHRHEGQQQSHRVRQGTAGTHEGRRGRPSDRCRRAPGLEPARGRRGSDRRLHARRCSRRS